MWQRSDGLHFQLGTKNTNSCEALVASTNLAAAITQPILCSLHLGASLPLQHQRQQHLHLLRGLLCCTNMQSNHIILLLVKCKITAGTSEHLAAISTPGYKTFDQKPIQCKRMVHPDTILRLVYRKQPSNWINRQKRCLPLPINPRTHNNHVCAACIKTHLTRCCSYKLVGVVAAAVRSRVKLKPRHHGAMRQGAPCCSCFQRLGQHSTANQAPTHSAQLGSA